MRTLKEYWVTSFLSYLLSYFSHILQRYQTTFILRSSEMRLSPGFKIEIQQHAVSNYNPDFSSDGLKKKKKTGHISTQTS